MTEGKRLLLKILDFQVDIYMPESLAVLLRDEFTPYLADEPDFLQKSDFTLNITEKDEGEAESFYKNLDTDPKLWVNFVTLEIISSLNWTGACGEIFLFKNYNSREVPIIAYGILSIFFRLKLSQKYPTAAIHAAAFETSAGAVLLPAASGGGKSTLSFLMNQKGYGYLGDEDAIVIEKEDNFYLFPFFRRLRIAPAVLESIPEYAAGAAPGPDFECFGQTLRNAKVEYGTKIVHPVPISAVIILRQGETHSPVLQEASSREALRGVLWEFEALPTDGYPEKSIPLLAMYNRNAFELLNRLIKKKAIYIAHYQFPLHLKNLIEEMTNMKPNIKQALWRRKESILFRNIEEESVVFDEDTGEAFFLNEVAAFLFEKLDGRQTVADLVRIAQAEYEGDSRQIEKDILGMVKELMNLGVIEVAA